MKDRIIRQIKEDTAKTQQETDKTNDEANEVAKYALAGVDVLGATARFFGSNIARQDQQIVATMVTGALKCGMGIGAAVSSMGMLSGVAVTHCVPFLAGVVSTFIRKFFIKELENRQAAPTFINELQWTAQYLQELEGLGTVKGDKSSIELNREYKGDGADDTLSLVR